MRRQDDQRRSWPGLVPDRDDKRRPSIRERQLVFESQFSKLYQVTADFDSFSKEYVVNDLGSRAGVVIVVDDRVLLVQQYRLLVDRVSWEIPGGAVDGDEDPADAAVRECLEETGIRCVDVQPILTYQLSLDTLHNPTHLYYSHAIVQADVPRATHPGEIDRHEWVSLSRCVEMVFAGEIEDSFSIIALLGYRAMMTLSKT